MVKSYLGCFKAHRAVLGYGRSRKQWPSNKIGAQPARCCKRDEKLLVAKEKENDKEKRESWPANSSATCIPDLSVRMATSGTITIEKLLLTIELLLFVLILPFARTHLLPHLFLCSVAWTQAMAPIPPTMVMHIFHWQQQHTTITFPASRHSSSIPKVCAPCPSYKLTHFRPLPSIRLAVHRGDQQWADHGPFPLIPSVFGARLSSDSNEQRA